jgi:hypothetical protein
MRSNDMTRAGQDEHLILGGGLWFEGGRCRGLHGGRRIRSSHRLSTGNPAGGGASRGTPSKLERGRSTRAPNRTALSALELAFLPDEQMRDGTMYTNEGVAAARCWRERGCRVTPTGAPLTP